jgi:hypothetical protein
MDAASPVIARGTSALGTGARRRFARRVTNGGPPRGLIVAFIAGEPGMAERMLAEHRDDGTGHCRVCTEGAQAGRKVWPCPLHGLAEQASRQKR